MDLIKCTPDALVIAGKEFPHAGRKSSITISGVPGSGVGILVDEMVSQAHAMRQSVVIIPATDNINSVLPRVIDGLKALQVPSWVVVESGAFLDLLSHEQYKQLDEKIRIVQCTQEVGVGEDIAFKGVNAAGRKLGFSKAAPELVLAVRDQDGMAEVMVPLPKKLAA